MLEQQLKQLAADAPEVDPSASVAEVVRRGRIRLVATRMVGGLSAAAVVAAGVLTVPLMLEEPTPTPEVLDVAPAEDVAFTANQARGSSDASPPTEVFWGTAQPGTKIVVESQYGTARTLVPDSGEWMVEVTFHDAPVGEPFPVEVNSVHAQRSIWFEFERLVCGVGTGTGVSHPQGMMPGPRSRGDRLVHERHEDLTWLQRLLDDSYARSGEHFRSIHTPATRIGAERLAEELKGVTVLALGTVTADGRPRLGGVDGLFYRGRFHVGSSPDSVRFRHLRERPAVSATHLRGEDLAVTVHGTARFIDVEADEAAGFREVCREVYGRGWDDFGLGAPYVVIDPEFMAASDLAALRS